jgi:hypothetical protein
MLRFIVGANVELDMRKINPNHVKHRVEEEGGGWD